ncbi:MAG: S9 family peptidase [Burkholderiaceae bacterium]
MKITSSLFIACLLILSGCAIAPTHSSLQKATLPDIIPVRDFVADRQSNDGYQVSPDGKKLAWYGVSGVRPAIFVKSLDSQEQKIFEIHPRYFHWSADSRHLLFVADHGGDENTHIYLGSVDGIDSDLKDLTPYDKTVAHIVRVVKGGTEVVITDNRRDKKVFDLYKLDLTTGTETMLATNPGKVTSWLTDHLGNVVARVMQAGDKEVLQHKPTDTEQAWATVAEWNIFDIVYFLELSDDGKSVWAVSNRGRDKSALVKLDLANGNETVVYADPDVDVAHAKISARSLQPLLAGFEPEYPKTEFFDARLRAGMHELLDGKPAVFHLLSIDDEERRMTVWIGTDHGARNYLYDAETGKATLLGESKLMRKSAPLASVKPIAFQSRDGLTLHGYLTLPVGVVPEKLPLVLAVHGGPWARDTWMGVAESSQFLANRGYAVLNINYRGSLGYGRIFLEKAIGEFAGKMHDDLIDGVNWAISTGLADPNKIAIAGRSYGGYATLVGMTFTPDVFACGVASVGPTDLARLLENVPPYWDLGMPWWHRYVGDPANPEDRKKMDAKSPLFKAAAVTKPILIMHGVNDVRVKLEQSELMVDALRKAGKQVDYVTFQNDGHRNRNWTNNLTHYRKMEDFLASCLGGRSSGFDFYQLGAWAM